MRLLERTVRVVNPLDFMVFAVSTVPYALIADRAAQILIGTQPGNLGMYARGTACGLAVPALVGHAIARHLADGALALSTPGHAIEPRYFPQPVGPADPRDPPGVRGRTGPD